MGGGWCVRAVVTSLRIDREASVPFDTSLCSKVLAMPLYRSASPCCAVIRMICSCGASTCLRSDISATLQLHHFGNAPPHHSTTAPQHRHAAMPPPRRTAAPHHRHAVNRSFVHCTHPARGRHGVSVGIRQSNTSHPTPTCGDVTVHTRLSPAPNVQLQLPNTSLLPLPPGMCNHPHPRLYMCNQVL